MVTNVLQDWQNMLCNQFTRGTESSDDWRWP